MQLGLFIMFRKCRVLNMQERYRIALLKACRIVGGQTQLAGKIKVGRSRLNKWINRNKGSVPFLCAIDIETATLGQITCYELVPEWERIVEHCLRYKNEIKNTGCISDTSNLTVTSFLENDRDDDDMTE